MRSAHTPPVPYLEDEILDRRYRLLEPLGDGGMGTVFLAEHVLIKRRFAIKFLRRELASDAGMVRRFLDEAMAAGTLGHPHIAAATDMGFTAEHVPYIVYEYLDGAILSDELTNGVMTVRRAVTIALQVASALECAHEAGIVHLDLKADNVFLVDRPSMHDHVKVLDFGIARFLRKDAADADRDQVWGTPEYMAPEQIHSPGAVDRRTDVYALGVLLYEMLCGCTPFAGADVRVVVHRAVFDPPPPMARPHVPAELERFIIERLLAKAPAARVQSMREVEAALRPFLARAAIVRGSSPGIPIPILPELARAPTQPVAAPPLPLTPTALPRASAVRTARPSYWWSRRAARPTRRRDQPA